VRVGAVLTAATPGAAAVDAVVETFGGLGEEFVASVQQALELAARGTCVPSAPASSLVDRIIDALAGGGNGFAFVQAKVDKRAAAWAGVTGAPGAAVVDGVFDRVFGGVDVNQLVADDNRFWHSGIIIIKVDCKGTTNY